MKYKLAILTSHPIQYQAPLFRKLSAHPQIDLTVYFCSDRGVTETIDPGFGVTFKWDVPLLEGYRHKFLQANHADGRAPRRARRSIPARLIMDLRNNHYDAIVLHGYALPANYVAYLAAWLTKTPVIFRGETILRNEQPLWQKAAKRVLLTWLFRHTGAFLPIGTKSWEFYRHYGVAEDRLFLAPYAVDNDFFLAQAQAWQGRKESLKLSLGIGEDLPVILYASKMTERKRPFDLLRAFERMQRPAALVFAGDGELRKEMEDYVRLYSNKRVLFAGFKNQTELPQYYAMADVFVLPSSYEPWGLVINEAMCFGLPIITTDSVAAAADLVGHGKNGLVYRSGDVAGLAAALDDLIRDPEKRRSMGQRSLQTISRWNYDACVRSILDALKHVHHRRAHGGEEEPDIHWRDASGKNEMPDAYAPRNSGLKFHLLQRVARVTRKCRPSIWTEYFLRFIHNPDARQTDHFEITMEYDSHLLINVNSTSFIEWLLFFYGYYEPCITRLIKHLFRPGFVAFDVGANIGCHTLIMGWLAREEGKVVAVEPHPKVFNRLVENIGLNRMSNIKPLPCAFSDVHERLTLYGFEECDTNQGVSSLYASNVGQHAVEILVPARTLDEVMQAENYNRLDFIKIDTEGSEHKVLLGGKESIRRHRPYIIFEYDEAKLKSAGCDFLLLKSFFSELNYSMRVIQGDYLTKVEHGLPKSTNILAFPRRV